MSTSTRTPRPVASEPIDTPHYVGNSPVRLIAHWHYGHQSTYTEVLAYDTRIALRALVPDMPEAEIERASYAMRRPNDYPAAPIWGGWSWYWIAQVWAWDTRPAAEVIADAHAKAARS